MKEVVFVENAATVLPEAATIMQNAGKKAYIKFAQTSIAAHPAETVNLILETSNNEGLCHEGFNKDEPSEYTRFWFAWANSLFAELVYQTYFVK